MKTFGSADEILNFAIEREEEAAAFYRGLKDNTKWPWMTDTFEEFAREEDRHKAKLEGVKKGKLLMSSTEKVTDLRIGDYLAEPETSGELDYQNVLIIAMKREKKSFKLYTDLAAIVDDANLRDTFLTLAQEEARHKLRFELEYDEHILTDN
jgi:rubrerythrin